MEQMMIEKVLPNSIFGALFLWLFFYTLKRNDVREKQIQEKADIRETKLQEIISDLTCKFGVAIDIIKDDVKCIKDKVFK